MDLNMERVKNVFSTTRNKRVKMYVEVKLCELYGMDVVFERKRYRR